MTLESVKRETEIRVRREYEEEILEKQDKAGKRGKWMKPKYACVIMCFAVAAGGVLMWKKDSSHGWMFTKGFITGGSAAAAGVFLQVFSGDCCGRVSL